MHFKKLFVLIIFSFIVGSSLVMSVGIGQFFSQRIIPFVPNTETELKLSVFDSAHIHVALEGDLAQYSSIVDADPDGGPRTITIRLTFPEYLEPGDHTLYLVASETSAAEGTVGGLASVRAGIKAFALYPAKHPLLESIIANDINVNDKTEVGISTINYGEDLIDSAHGIIKIYNEENTLVATLDTDSSSVESYQTVSMTTTLDGAEYNLTPGTYRVNASLVYDGVEYPTSMESTFRVGQMNVNVVDSTNDVFVNSTNKYKLTIESDWAGTIKDVYAKISMPNGKVLKTPNVDLTSEGNGRKGAAELETYWETEGLSVGTYNADITVYYSGQTITKTVKVNVIEGTAPEIAKPKEMNSTMLISIIIAIAVILFTGLYFLVFRKNGQESNQRSRSEPRKTDDNEIRPPSM